MSRRLAWMLHAANALVGATGLALAWLVFVAETGESEAVYGHPWQTPLQHAHILAAVPFLFVLGATWAMHTWPKWSSGARGGRSSGLALVALGFPMIASGYLLQISESLEARAAWSLAHTLASLAWIFASLAHLWAARRARRV